MVELLSIESIAEGKRLWERGLLIHSWADEKATWHKFSWHELVSSSIVLGLGDEFDFCKSGCGQ